MTKKRAPLSDAEILQIVASERAASQGEGDELAEDRARSYDYLFGKADTGYLAQDLPADLSKAVSTDLNDAVETLLPDLIEIFTAGENVVAFTPTSEEDEEQAAQETDYVNHVFYNDNPGWFTLYTGFKDALISKTGVFKWWWEECEDWDEFVFEDKTEEEWKLLKATIEKGDIELADIAMDEVAPDPETGLYTFRARRKATYGKSRQCAVPPEDFRCDPNATIENLSRATWAANRARPRAYELIDQDFDPELVAELRGHDAPKTEDERARKLEDDREDQPEASHAHDLLRRVEIWEYHIWLDMDGDGKVECWKIITGNDDGVLLDKEQISGIQYAVLCPYPTTHQLYGRSVADLVMEVQRIKTALMRLGLNAMYFGVNPRPVVDMAQTGEFTLSDLYENKPGKPIRTRGGLNAVQWQTPPIVGEQTLPWLEYMSTVAEGRTGVVRNAQGLNPDTLHDTAKGAMELMSAAQRRVRMIARIFAETGVKDLFVGLHDLIVRHARKKATVRLRNAWVEVDPNKWGRRKDLTVEVGLGANTKTGELQFWGGFLTILQNAAASGVAITPQHVFNAVKKFLQAGNVKNPAMYWPDPSKEEGGEQQQAPNPDLVKVQGELQLKREEAQARLQIEQQRFNFEAELALWKAQMEAGLAERALQTEARIEAMVASRKIELETFKAKSDAQTKTMAAALSAKAKTDQANARVSNVRMGGQLG